MYVVLDHTNHIFSENLSFGDDIDGGKDLQKDKYKDTQTQTKIQRQIDSMYAIFVKGREFKD